MLNEDQMDCSILAFVGKGICWIFEPLGWGNWQATVASITGLVAIIEKSVLTSFILSNEFRCLLVFSKALKNLFLSKSRVFVRT